MISKFLLFTFFILVSFHSVISSKIYLNCYCSKYILYNLKTKVIYFNEILLVNPTNQILIENFAMGLQTLGSIVVAMFPHIKDEKINILRNLEGLWSTNFYLNNLSNTLLLPTYQNVTTQTRKLSAHEIFIDEFQKIYPMLIAQLEQNILDTCYEGKQIKSPDIVSRNQFADNNLHVIINNLLPKQKRIETIFMEENIEETMHEVNDTEVILRFHFNIKIENEEKNLYHPENVLLSILFDKNNYGRTLSELHNVPINEKLENGKMANMKVLFDMIKYTFDVDCVESFLRQVIAAIVYPVYLCVGKFALILQKIFSDIFIIESKVILRTEFVHLIAEKSMNICSIINDLTRICLPNNVQTHLKVTLNLLEGIIEIVKSRQFSKLKSGYIHELYWRCAKAMEYNLIHFDTGVDNSDKYDQEKCEKMLNQLDFKVDNISMSFDVTRYVYQNLNLKNTSNVVFFKDVFSEELKCNIIQRNKQGYHIMRKN
ncbi:uncharacterized protein LOC126902430 [Daktulosphaira vitifoliae]|uniref:uncharacterized protein LOC126902430 n=1 Tax=Daktulosphaira vitifoliae TaxID=58002 RepID=UPI0021AA016F|nr:uncharacterized protein LOC126902430 [Daktulosphaira vitifoliae]